MMSHSKYIFFLLALCLTHCGGGKPSWESSPYDLTQEKTLHDVIIDITALSGKSWTLDNSLESALQKNPTDLPTLVGLSAAEVLTLLQDMMPPETSFLYEQQPDGTIKLVLHYQEAESFPSSSPAILNFDPGLGQTLPALVSEAQFDEICGDPELFDFLGDQGIFDILAEVSSDPSGHSEFIGNLPSTLQYQFDGTNMTLTGTSPWVTLSGPLNADGTLTCLGSGLVAGYPNVSVEFTGLVSTGGLTGTLTMGAGGELPEGTSAVYTIQPNE